MESTGNVSLAKLHCLTQWLSGPLLTEDQALCSQKSFALSASVWLGKACLGVVALAELAQSGRAALLPGRDRNTWSKSWIWRVQTGAQKHRLALAGFCTAGTVQQGQSCTHTHTLLQASSSSQEVQTPRG